MCVNARESASCVQVSMNTQRGHRMSWSDKRLGTAWHGPGKQTRSSAKAVTLTGSQLSSPKILIFKKATLSSFCGHKQAHATAPMQNSEENLRGKSVLSRHHIATGLEPRSLGLVTNAFAHWVTLLAWEWCVDIHGGYGNSQLIIIHLVMPFFLLCLLYLGFWSLVFSTILQASHFP